MYKSLIATTFAALAAAASTSTFPSAAVKRNVSLDDIADLQNINGDVNGVSDNLIIALFNGINTNVIIQQNEQQVVLALINFMSSSDRDNRDVYNELFNNLVIVVDSSVQVRQSNQRLAEVIGINEDAINGLSVVADAQNQEVVLVQSLTGDADNDLPILNQLLDAFSGGAQQNQLNQQIVLLG
ncbi:hypothetical protein MPH_05816 [Macrophomina phaseolina MS6]|uniref:Uncharacterized protein n=2 Tax=Macrophomina phaseolina TaxID=35725 RepID=K2SJK4_MACPH|nr:hypothetical protein MPH_05816 [Macrophomina phaseolina MS6]KAH7049333.1 hypothetical protein B0J12DRAFT_740820 [Macrophomina phaseolina]